MSERERNQLPPGKDHRWLVIYRGEVQPELIEASSAYLARERACVRHQCEHVDVKIGLMPKGLGLRAKRARSKR